MSSANFDVVIVGGGCAGMTAALGLAKAGFGVAVVESAAYPGAENWSGCVYFCENLAHPDILGPEGVEALAWERRLVERGFFATDGHGLLGMTYRDPPAFRHCYTVLRPIFDHHMAQVATKLGVVLLNETTAESLIRDGGRVVGVSTNRGPLYGDLVFLAEGDASHLVTREGYERYPDQREAPKFLQGIKQVIDLPPGAIEETFGVGPEEGVAYEMLLRNGTLRGKHVHLNMGGFVYTNRQSLSVGLVLPTDHLRDHFGGDPNLLIEWFERLPALVPWLKNGKRGVFGAKIIRGGGAKDIPRLIDEGLAIGGAASAIGIDFPYPNFTGPATRMALLLVQAARRIREEKGRFSQQDLEKHYLAPLQQTHYWADVEFLRRWPGYVKRTTAFFDRHLDLVLGSAYVWTRPRRWFVTRWINWLRLVWQVAGPTHWPHLRTDLRHLTRGLRVTEVIGRPGIWRLMLDGTVNALRDMFGSPRPHLTEAGELKLHYSVAGGAEVSGPAPKPARRWFRRLMPVLASAAGNVYANDEQPLAKKLNKALGLLLRQVNMLDVVAAGALAMAAGLSLACLTGFWRLLRRRPGPVTGKLYQPYVWAVERATDLTPLVAEAGLRWESRLGQLAYQSARDSHIHVLWPNSLAEKNAVVKDGLWHVCPAHVYEARQSALGQLQIVVNYENCIKCETCWRTSDLVDWGRDGKHLFIYPVNSGATRRLLETQSSLQARPALPRSLDWWGPSVREVGERLKADRPALSNGHYAAELAELAGLFDQLDRKLEEFDEALAEEPRTLDKARADYLEKLARYAQQVSLHIVELLANGTLADSPRAGVALAHQKLVALANALTKRAQERTRRTWDQKYSWAAADGRQIRQHHLVGLRRLLEVLAGERHPHGPASKPSGILSGLLAPSGHQWATFRWLRAEHDAMDIAAKRLEWAAQLDKLLPRTAWRELDRGAPLSSEQDALLRDLLAQVPALDSNNLSETLHPPVRKALLTELGRRDPSLAYRAAAHLWARDLARLAGSGSPLLSRASQKWSSGDEWASFAVVDAAQTSGSGWQGEGLLVPARGARRLLLLIGEQLAVVPVDSDPTSGLKIEPLATLGLRGAGMVRLRLDNFALPEERVGVDQSRIKRAWGILSAADLTSIAFGMADVLCERAVAHADSRVQFPGLFHDEEARDTIGKFGAVKQMLAEMAARRFLLETLDHTLSPVDLSARSAEQAGLVKVIVAEALGTSPGSLTYNAGQIFGGTGFSEDDILAKFYRDAAAWRYVGLSNVEILRSHGEELLHSWRSDGHRLAGVAGEAEVFDELAQRKALQNELDQVRVFRSHLRGVVNDWLATNTLQPAGGASNERPTLSPRAASEVGEGLARQDAHLLASKALLLRVHARLERGLTSETEMALLRVWLLDSSFALEDFESILRLHVSLAGMRDDHPIVEPGAGSPSLTYRDYLAAPNAYDSGDFLDRPVDLAKPRFVPEMIDADPELAARQREICEQVGGYFGQPRGEGLPYERYVERQHHPDAADLDFCRQHGYFRFPIPKELGGEARSKVDYYLLTTNCQRLADVSISLTIQVNTSLGTTPVLLARDKELPRAQKELTQFAGDRALHDDIAQRLTRLESMIGTREQSAVAKGCQEIDSRLKGSIHASVALRALAHRFLGAWQQAVQAGMDFDQAGVRLHVKLASSAWNDVCERAREQANEMGRRREACDLFLRWIASGQISAFALTEPSAGSDTARVGTRAVLRSAPVEREADGALRFTPVGTVTPRYLLDARLLEFRKQGNEYRVYYRWAPQDEPAPIGFDEYDYETDDPERLRYYDHGGRRIHFTDIAQLRERDGHYWYDYWELTGAKMWITNGRMAGVMCLYAKTPEGITGFLVDRHAEGLVVGKDEDKLGQCGSPTNELSLQAVRVPRENVIGVEGRGQVNALETLNVGRAGLAMSAMAQMAGLIEQSRAVAQANYGAIPDWVEWRLQRMGEERFTAEALAHEVIGRFEHSQTKSVRLESAIAKALVSESLHRVIELAEDIHGLAGQTQLHLVEKRKRDARVLNIYEGTNEIQRFFILKDLASAHAEAPAKDERKTRHTSPEALELESLRLNVRQRVKTAAGLFGQDIWQNPNLQASCFLLSEAVAWLKAADSVLARLAWSQGPGDRGQESGVTGQEAGGKSQPAEAGAHLTPDSWLLTPDSVPARRAWLRCVFEVRNRLRRFDEELSHLRRGFYAEEVRAAGLLFRHDKAAPASLVATTRISRPLSVLVIVEPSAATVPHPHVEDGRLAEPYWTLTAADRSALETALQLRDQAVAPVTIHVAAVGPRGAAGVLRDVLSLGVDRARLLLAEAEPCSTDSAAAAMAATLRSSSPYDLILSGVGKADYEDGVLGGLTAEALGVAHSGDAARLAVRFTDTQAETTLQGSDQRQHLRSLPAAVAIEPDLPLRNFSTAGYLGNLAKAVEIERWPRRLEARPVVLAEAIRAAEKVEDIGVPLAPDEAAVRVLEEIGIKGGQAMALSAYPGAIETIANPSLAGRAVAVLAADASGRLDAGARLVVQAMLGFGQSEQLAPTVVVLVGADEEAQRRAVGQLHRFFAGHIILLVGQQTTAEAPQVRGRLLRECWSAAGGSPRVLVGAGWAEWAFAGLANLPKTPERAGPGGNVVALRVRRLARDGEQIVMETLRGQGKLRASERLPADATKTYWLTLTADAEVVALAPEKPSDKVRVLGNVERWAPRLERFFAGDEIQRLLAEAKNEVGVARLADAEFIIDVGFGVGNRDGYEAVIDPLEKTLRGLGVRGLVIGGSRKVTEELHLLPADRQIGQSGASVNPKIILAIGVSGAPQHLNYIGPRATVLAFNRDSEAPIMTLNRRQPRPRVLPIVGDLFETVPALIAALKREAVAEAPVVRAAAASHTA